MFRKNPGASGPQEALGLPPSPNRPEGEGSLPVPPEIRHTWCLVSSLKRNTNSRQTPQNLRDEANRIPFSKVTKLWHSLFHLSQFASLRQDRDTPKERSLTRAFQNPPLPLNFLHYGRHRGPSPLPHPPACGSAPDGSKNIWSVQDFMRGSPPSFTPQAFPWVPIILPGTGDVSPCRTLPRTHGWRG